MAGYLAITIVWAVVTGLTFAMEVDNHKRYNKSAKQKRYLQYHSWFVLSSPVWPIALGVLIFFVGRRMAMALLVAATKGETR